MSTYLSLDIGTSSTKASLYRQNGLLIAGASAGYDVLYPRAGWAEQSPEIWWTATQEVCQNVLEAANPRELRAICISGQTPLCVPVDRGGRPLRPAILWLDRRSASQAQWLRENFSDLGRDHLEANTYDSYFGGTKWLWFKQYEPDLYDRTWKILQANSYIVFHLTGEVIIDHSQAGLCSPCYQLERREWDAYMCERMGIDIHKLPEIHPSFEPIGEVTRKAAEATGIPAGTPVACGAGDFACACLGAGIYRAGRAAMMLGTAGNLLVPAPQRTDPRLLNTVHVTGEGLSVGGVLAGGAVNWFREMLRIDQKDLLSVLDEEAARVPPGANGLIFLPYLLGERTPIWDPQARGVFLGLSANQPRGALFRAVLEGVAFAFRQMMEIYAEIGCEIQEVVAIDGGARSPVWRQIFADVLGVPVYWRPNSGGTALGGAFLAALTSGDCRSFDEVGGWLESTLDVEPRQVHTAVYQRNYAVFCQLYERVKEFFPILAKAALDPTLPPLSIENY